MFCSNMQTRSQGSPNMEQHQFCQIFPPERKIPQLGKGDLLTLTDRASGTLTVHQVHSFSFHGVQLREVPYIFIVATVEVAVQLCKRLFSYIVYENSYNTNLHFKSVKTYN